MPTRPLLMDARDSATDLAVRCKYGVSAADWLLTGQAPGVVHASEVPDMYREKPNAGQASMQVVIAPHFSES